MIPSSPDTLLSPSIEPGPSDRRPLLTPHPDTFARYPQCWYYACPADAVPAGARVAVELCGQRLVVFRGTQGQLCAVAARCPHLGSDLGAGRVVGETIECPYHRLRFDRDGYCRQHDLRVRAYATHESFGSIFVYLGTQPRFEFPSFDDGPDLINARPLAWQLATQWYMVGANAFDARHFAAAHGRRLLGAPSVDHPDACAMRVRYEYEIEGVSLIDRIVRSVSGAKVRFEVTSWCGNVLLVRARFKRDVSYGVVIVQPRFERASACDITVIVNSVLQPGWIGHVTSRLRLSLKRFAIRRLLLDDFTSLHRLDHVHDGLVIGDEVLAQYLRWVRVVAPSADEVPL